MEYILRQKGGLPVFPRVRSGERMKPRPFRIERYFAPREFTACHVLCASDCEPYRVSELLDMDSGAEARLRDLKLGYTETRGAEALREQIAQLYQKTSADDVIVHTGAEEAVFTVASAVLRAGDHAIVHAPSYQSLHEVARSIGCHVTYWEAHANDGWSLDLDYLRNTVHESTRLVVVILQHQLVRLQPLYEDTGSVQALAHDREVLHRVQVARAGVPGDEQVAHDHVEGLGAAEQVVAAVGDHDLDARVVQYAEIRRFEGVDDLEHARNDLDHDHAFHTREHRDGADAHARGQAEEGDVARIRVEQQTQAALTGAHRRSVSA